MVTKICELLHEIGHNSPYVRDITHILATSKGIGGRLTARHCSDWPLLLWQRKFVNFSTKLAITQRA